MTIAQLDPTYDSVRQKLQAYFAGEANAVLQGNAGLDVGQTFDAVSLAPADVTKVFSREAIGTQFQTAFDGKKLTIGKVQSLTLQSDTLAGVEKAFRMRHRTRLELLVSGVSRARGLSSAKGFVAHAMARIPLKDTDGA